MILLLAAPFALLGVALYALIALVFYTVLTIVASARGLREFFYGYTDVAPGC